MFCDHCGAQLREDQEFCHSCGRSFQAAATPRNRVASHIRVLGILWIVYSLIHLIPIGGMFMFGTMGLPWIPHAVGRMFVGSFLTVIGGLMAICTVAGIVAGWGLLERCGWARMLALVLGCLALFNIPFGTALGIYTLWVLLPSTSEQEFRQLSGAV